jgi:hypothetical protein
MALQGKVVTNVQAKVCEKVKLLRGLVLKLKSFEKHVWDEMRLWTEGPPYSFSLVFSLHLVEGKSKS